MRRSGVRPAVAGLFLTAGLLAGRAVSAQDAQYWSIQYGPVGQLLGGQVVGSVRDLSATYYNPGGLALGEDPDFLLSVQGLRAQKFTIEPVGGGAILDTSKTSFDDFPGFVAFALPQDWLGRDTRLGVSLLTRQQFNERIDQRFAGRRDDGAYGLETLFDQEMSETWGGVTLSRRLSDRLGLGVTLYGVYRGQRTRWEQSLQIAQAGGRGVTALVVDDFDYSHWRALAKLGVAWDGDSLRLGLGVTTPSASLFGGGSAGYTRSATGVDLNGDGQADTLLVNGVDEDIPSSYKSSWSVSGGAAWRRGSLQLHASVEWFAPVDRFTVLEGSTDPTTGTPVLLFQDLRSVLNAGAGVEYWLGGRSAGASSSRGTVLYGAFATDFSASPEVMRGEASSSNQDWYHITGGVGFGVGSSRFSLGVDYAFGSKERELGFGGLPPEVPVIGEPRPVKTHTSRWVLALGYLFGKD
jgi:hypothetical protein